METIFKVNSTVIKDEKTHVKIISVTLTKIIGTSKLYNNQGGIIHSDNHPKVYFIRLHTWRKKENKDGRVSAINRESDQGSEQGSTEKFNDSTVDEESI